MASSQGKPTRIHRLILFTPAGVHAQLPRVSAHTRVLHTKHVSKSRAQTARVPGRASCVRKQAGVCCVEGERGKRGG
eukprot:scaffold1076_cov20-Tisochrysis_lutea.AAC.2